MQLIGAALTGVGVYLYLQTVEIGTCINDEVAPLMIVLVAIGGVLLITALFGLCGVCKKRSFLLSGVSLVFRLPCSQQTQHSRLEPKWSTTKYPFHWLDVTFTVTETNLHTYRL